MQSGKPFIRREDVREALDLLIYTSRPREIRGLQNLLVIRLFIIEHDIPQGDYQYDLAVQQFLTQIITNELCKHRNLYGLESPIASETVEFAENCIAEASEQNNIELICWTWLYYRYVRVDLDLPPQHFSDLIAVDERTLRRYQSHAIDRLLTKIMEAEQAARRVHRKLQMYSVLPSSFPKKLIGRDEDLEALRQLTASSPPFVHVYGAPGLGKTTLVQEFVRELIDTHQVDHVIWVDQPDSIETIQDLLSHFTGTAGNFADFEVLSLYFPIVVILDDVEAIPAVQLCNLLKAVGNATVLMTSTDRLIDCRDLKMLKLRELEQAAASALLELLKTSDIEGLTEIVGGNPLLLQLIARNPDLYHTGLLIPQAINQLFHTIFHGLTAELQSLWVLMAVLPPRCFTVMELKQVWFFESHLLDTFTRSGIVELEENGTIYILRPQRLFIHLFDHSAISDFIRLILAHISPLTSGLAYEVKEYILQQGWPELDFQTQRVWLEQIISGNRWHLGAHQREEILERMVQIGDSVSVRLELAKCYRLTGKTEAAKHLLETLITDCGTQGLFQEQAKAMTELGILLRQQGLYQGAMLLLNRAEQINTDAELGMRLKLELAQIALDTRNPDDYRRYAAGLPFSEHLLSMEAQLAAIYGNTEHTLHLLSVGLKDFGDNNRLLGQLYTAVGQSSLIHIDLETAAFHFAQAVHLLEQQDNLYALARAYANLGAVSLRLKSYTEALDLFERAEPLFRMFQDRIGLATVRHNLRLAHEAIALADDT